MSNDIDALASLFQTTGVYNLPIAFSDAELTIAHPRLTEVAAEKLRKYIISLGYARAQRFAEEMLEVFNYDIEVKTARTFVTIMAKAILQHEPSRECGEEMDVERFDLSGFRVVVYKKFDMGFFARHASVSLCNTRVIRGKNRF